MFVPAPQLTSTGGKIEFSLLHFSPRHCLGQYTEYLDVEGDPVVIYAEFEKGKVEDFLTLNNAVGAKSSSFVAKSGFLRNQAPG